MTFANFPWRPLDARNADNATQNFYGANPNAGVSVLFTCLCTSWLSVRRGCVAVGAKELRTGETLF